MENISTNSSYMSHTSTSHAKQRRSVSLLNLDSSRKSINESLFDILMKDPDKRTLILKMLSQENDNIKKYKDKLQKEELAKHRQIKKTQRLLHCESPTALQRRRALTRVEVDSDSGSSISSIATKITNELTVPFESLLEGVTVFVDIRSEGKDRSAGAKAIMQAMGASVLSHLTKNATHVLFKDGSFNTYQRAKLMKVHLVSVLWLEATRKNGVRAPEKHYPALGTESYDANITQICQEYEEAVREEYNRSQAFSSLKHRRRTALPSDLRSQTAFFDLNNLSSLREERSGRLSENLVPSSQAWEAESIISHTSSKLENIERERENREQPNDNILLDNPEETSDDSDCGVVNGESMTQERNTLYNLDLTIDNLHIKKVNPTNYVEASNSLADLRSSRVSVDSESNTSCRSLTLVSRTLPRRNMSSNSENVYNAEEGSNTNLIITNNKNRRTTLGVISNPSNEENLARGETLTNVSDMEITLNNSKRRTSENFIRQYKRKKSSISVPNFKENESSVITKSTNSLGTSINKVSISKNDSSTLSNLNENEIEQNKNDESDIINASTNSYRASTSKINLNSKTPKKNSRLSKVVDTSSSEVCSRKTRSSSFKNNSVSSKIVDTSSERVRTNTRTSAMASLEPSCEDMPSLRISMSSNERNSRISDIPSLRLSVSPSQKDKESGNLTKSKEVPIENPSAQNKESGNLTKSKEVPIENPSAQNKETQQVQPETNTSKINTQSSQGKPKVFRKLFNLNDPIDETEIESNEVPTNSQVKLNNVNLSSLPLTHLQPLHFTQTVLDVIKKKPGGNKSRIPRKQTDKKQQPPSEPKKPPNPNKTKSPKANKKSIKITNKEVTLKKAVRKSPRLESHAPDGNSEDEITIVPQLSRRSTLEFMEGSTPMRTQNFLTQRNKKVVLSIVCTRMHKAEVQTFIQIVKKLKGFTIEDEVSAKTSHLVVGDCKRTINLLRAITRGCWIVSKEWLFRSLEAGKWLKEEDYELTSFSSAVQECRKQRQAFNSLFSMDVFASCGPIYVSRNSVPRCSDLEELILACKGILADCARNASIVVGMWVRYEEVKCVNELWVLDCITFNKKKSFKHYLVHR